MRIQLKNSVFSILLLLCLIAPIATTGLFFHYQKKQIRREIKWKIIAGIDKNELVLLKFTDAEKKTKLRWKHSKEFEYSAEMYDIVETKEMGDTTYYWCWWDHEETKLNRQLSAVVSMAWGNNFKHNESQKKLVSFYKSLFFSQTKRAEDLNASIPIANPFYFCFIYYSIDHSPITPPPQFLHLYI